MNPFKLLGLATATAIGLAAQVHAALDVVLVVPDDLMPRIEGAKTPNLDALREHAVTFDHAYSQYPLWGSARGAFLTGMRPNAIGHEESFEIFRCSPPDVETLPQYFKNNGDASVRIGKIFPQGVPSDMGKPGRDDPQSWTYTINPPGRDREIEKVMANHTPGKGPGRAAVLLAGRSQHMAGGVAIGEAATGHDSIIPPSAVTVGRVLQGNGYSTAWLGKNHDTPTFKIGLFDQWPAGLGFDAVYGFIGAKTNPSALYQDHRAVRAGESDPADHMQPGFADRAVGWIRTRHSLASDRPFATYAAAGNARLPKV